MSHEAEVNEEPKVTRMIMCDTSDCLRLGSCSSVFKGTFSQKIVAVERIKKDCTDETLMLPTLLTLNHENVTKILHVEDTAEFRYIKCLICLFALDNFF